MPEPIYVPILKGKEGELAALEQLSSDVKNLILPLIEVPDIPHDYATDSPAKTLDSHLSGAPERLRRACGQMPFYFDLSDLGLQERLAGGMMAIEFMLTSLAGLGCRPVPVLQRLSSEAFTSATQAYSLQSGEGSCIRLKISDFEDDVDLESDLNRLLAGFFPNSAIDLVIDLGDLGSVAATATLIARSVFSMIPQKDRWRRIVLAAASFPQDLSDIGAGTIERLRRSEWHLWRSLQNRPSALPRRDLIFGDYAMANPVTNPLDPRTMRMSANIRYTTDEGWLVIKGKNVRQYGFSQYFDLCRLLIRQPEYCGRGFSWGDGFIADCAEATQGPGNATTWRKVGVNHHITLVARELASPLVVASTSNEPPR